MNAQYPSSIYYFHRAPGERSRRVEAAGRQAGGGAAKRDGNQRPRRYHCGNCRQPARGPAQPGPPPTLIAWCSIFPTPSPRPTCTASCSIRATLKATGSARFSENPLVTRVVIDLNSPQHFQIFPDGKTVIVKLMSDQQQASAKAHVENVSFPAKPAQPASNLDVQYKNGRLSVSADHVSLAQILNEVKRQTGTEITIPPGGGQEQIVVGISPQPLREALVSLLNGSRFNFIMLDSDREPGKLKSVILTYRSAGGGTSEPAIAPPPPQPTQSRARSHAHTRTRNAAPASRRASTRNPATTGRPATGASPAAGKSATPTPGRSSTPVAELGSIKKCRRERPRSCGS